MQYEYIIIRQQLGAAHTRLLNEYGEDGWELCATELVEERGFEYTRFIFKRRKFGERVELRHDPVRPLAHAKKEPVSIHYYNATDHMSQHDREAYAEATNR